MKRQLGALLVACAAVVNTTLAADPWADEVVAYAPGTTIGPGSYQMSGGVQAIGEPSRDTGTAPWGSQVGVFYSPYNSDQLTSIGPGGSLTVKFNEPVTNDPFNPFGIDLLVFGNAFYGYDGNLNVVAPFAEQGIVEVSQDNMTWFTIPSTFVDGEFPTLGYADTLYNPSTFANEGGTVLTDFTKPVNPSLVFTGMTEAQVNAAYAGSGGGTGIDLGTVGLEWIQYVRITGAADGIEIDALADVTAVPEPATALLALGMLMVPFIRHRVYSTRSATSLQN